MCSRMHAWMHDVPWRIVGVIMQAHTTKHLELTKTTVCYTACAHNICLSGEVKLLQVNLNKKNHPRVHLEMLLHEYTDHIISSTW